MMPELPLILNLQRQPLSSTEAKRSCPSQACVLSSSAEQHSHTHSLMICTGRRTCCGAGEKDLQ